MRSTYAAQDTAALYSREPAFEREFVSRFSGDLADKVGNALAKGDRFMVPSALNQMIREVIEWCADGADESLGVVGRAEIVHLLLSINGDQEAEDRPECYLSEATKGRQPE